MSSTLSKFVQIFQIIFDYFRLTENDNHEGSATMYFEISWPEEATLWT